MTRRAQSDKKKSGKGALIERTLLATYARLPKGLRKLVSPRLREKLLGMLTYVDSRPTLKAVKLRRLALDAAERQDWSAAAEHWQHMAALTHSGIGQADTATDMDRQRRLAYARTQLRLARIEQAKIARAQGNTRAFNELVARVVESIPDQRVFKNAPEIVELVALYVKDALRADGYVPRAPSQQPRQLVFCLDVLKISKVHTHARTIFAMCRNLMAHDPDLHCHLVVTNERFAVTTPIVTPAFTPTNASTVEDMARAAFPEDFGTRMHLHMLPHSGLEGLVDSCKTILDIAPDVILYGGGHKGMFSNESRVIRHALFPFLPTGFFFIQSSNEVDEKIDMIIMRGPHDLLGTPGQAEQVIQPYPTVVRDVMPETDVITPQNHAKRVIVSAITGVRMGQLIDRIDDKDLKLILSILDRVPGSVWHFIGARDPDGFIARNALIRKRVNAGQLIVHPVLSLEAFTQLVEQASLFYHMPGFTGGSGGATVARKAGIPILTFQHSDVSGRQPAETIFKENNVAPSVSLAVTLLQDIEEWERIVRLQFSHTRWIHDTSAQRFYACLTRTIELYHARQNQRLSAESPEQSD